MDNINKKIIGATLAGLFTGILIGYVLGVNRGNSDDKFLSQWVKDCGDYEDGNVFGYETGLPENYHEKMARDNDKAAKPQRSSLK